jgi:FG-GAP-like repeat
MRDIAFVFLAASCPSWLTAQAPREVPLLTVDEYRLSGALGDINGDGRIDLVLGKNGPFALRLGLEPLADGALRFDAEQAIGQGIEVAVSCESAGQPRLLDLDGDGDLDLVALDTPLLGRVGPTGVVWFANEGGGRFGPRTMLHKLQAPVPREPAQIELVDWNGDGTRDLLVGGQGGAFLLPGTAAGFQAAEPIDGPRPTYGMAALDWDGDGTIDLVAAEQDGVHVYGRIDGKLQRIDRLGGIATDQCQLAAVDHDGNGRLDLLIAEKVELPGEPLPEPEVASMRRHLRSAQDLVRTIETAVAAENEKRPPFDDAAAMARRQRRLDELHAWAEQPRLAIARMQAELVNRPRVQSSLRVLLR